MGLLVLERSPILHPKSLDTFNGRVEWQRGYRWWFNQHHPRRIQRRNPPPPKVFLFSFSHVSGSKSHSVPASSSKRRRVRGKVEEEAGPGKVFSIEAREISNNLLEVEQVLNETSKTYNHSHIRIRAYSSMTSCVSGSPNNTSGENPDCTILDYIQPQWIVLFDPDIGFVRRYGETLILSWELQDSGPRDSR